MIPHLRSAFVVTVVSVLTVAGCAGDVEDDDELVIDDSDSALTASNESSDGDERADDGCRDGDREGHKHHHRHWFKLLDLLDGTRDKAITLSALDGLPDRLVAKLTKMDANGDGVVTKKEVKRALKRHRGDD